MPNNLSQIIGSLQPFLKSWEFAGHGRNFRKILENAVAVLNFQADKFGDGFYINLGAQPLFVPTELNLEPDPQIISEEECIFRKRVDPPLGLRTWPQNVQVWGYDLELVPELRAALEKAFRDYLQQICAVPGLITAAKLSDFPTDENTEHPILGYKHPRRMLHFARIAKATSQPDKAQEFATYAMENCPEYASSLRADLEVLLATMADQQKLS